MSLYDMSGAWQGRWWQGRDTGYERLDLMIQEGRVMALGRDKDGEFQYSGVIHPDGIASLRKVYTKPFIEVPASLSYVGQWNGEAIHGVWIDDAFPAFNHGPFRLWPSRRDEPAGDGGRG